MEAISDDEPNTIVLNVTKDMTKEDVLAEILRRTREINAGEKSSGGVTKLLDGYYKGENHYCRTFRVGEIWPGMRSILVQCRLMETIQRARITLIMSMLLSSSTGTLERLTRP